MLLSHFLIFYLQNLNFMVLFILQGGIINMNELLVDRLKNARTNQGLKQQDVAKQLGIKANTISNWEKGRTEPDIDTFVKLCDIYQLDCASLLSEVYAFNRISKDITLPEYEHIKKYRSLDTFGQETVSITLDRECKRVECLQEKDKRISYLENNSVIAGKETNTVVRLYTYMHKIACAGNGFYFDDIPTDTIEAPYLPGADFIIGVNGDSMEPTYKDGDLVYVEKKQIIEIGEIGVFILNNECFIKEAGEDGLISHNKKYDPIPGTEKIQCIGKVLGVVKMN